MITDAALADLCLALYQYSWGPSVAWDHIEQPSSDDGVMWGLKRQDGYDVVVLRGSTTIRDWVRDLYALANPFVHQQLGPMHPGFYDGCDEAWTALTPMLRNPLVLCGHSLGAAHAAILTAFGVLEDRPPVRRVMFGEPRPGFAKFRDIVSRVSTTSYRNRYDIVPSLPIHIGLEAYCNSAPLTNVNVSPHGVAFMFGPLAAHHMLLYREAMK